MLLALCAYFALASSKLRAQIHKQEASPELVAARQEDARYEPFAALLESGALRNGRLRLCNRSSRPLEISWLAAVSLQKDALPAEADAALAAKADGFRLVTYNSGFCGRDFRVSLPARRRAERGAALGQPRCRFDGRAVFYASRCSAPPPSPSPRRRRRLRSRAAGGARRGPPEERPGDPGTTYWQAGLLGGKDECVSVGAGW